MNKIYLKKLSITLVLIGLMNTAYATRNNYYNESYLDNDFSSLGINISRLNPTNNSFRPKSLLVGRTLALAPTPGSIVEEYHDPIDVNNKTIRNLPFKTTLPNITSWLNAVKDQGELGTCASFTAIECLKFVHNKDSLSQAYMIVKAEQSEDCLNNGLTIGTAMKTAEQTGTIGQSWWKYPNYLEQVRIINKDQSNTSNWNVCMRIPYNHTQESELIKFGFQEVKNLFALEQGSCAPGQKCDFRKDEDIKVALELYKTPVAIATSVRSNSEWDRTGNISTKSGDETGYHGVTIYGYDDKKQVFNFKNSWGKNWGNQGLGTISYSYVQDCVSEAWIGTGSKLSA